MFQDTLGKRKTVKDIDEIFNRDLMKIQERRETDIPAGSKIE